MVFDQASDDRYLALLLRSQYDVLAPCSFSSIISKSFFYIVVQHTSDVLICSVRISIASATLSIVAWCP